MTFPKTIEALRSQLRQSTSKPRPHSKASPYARPPTPTPPQLPEAGPSTPSPRPQKSPRNGAPSGLRRNNSSRAGTPALSPSRPRSQRFMQKMLAASSPQSLSNGWASSQTRPNTPDPLSSPLLEVLRRYRVPILHDTISQPYNSLPRLAGCILTPSAINTSLSNNEIFYHVQTAAAIELQRLQYNKLGLSPTAYAALRDTFMVELGAMILDTQRGPLITYIDVKLDSTVQDMVKAACALMDKFIAKNYSPSRIIISIPATQPGVRAAKILSDVHQIQVNLTHVTGVLHAAVCAQAHATCITIAAQPMIDYFNGHDGPTGQDHIRSIHLYYKLHNIPTKIIGTQFGTAAQVCRLASSFDTMALTTEDFASSASNTFMERLPSPSNKIALALARQVQPPASLPCMVDDTASDDGFVPFLSQTMRGAFTAIVYEPMGELKVEKQHLEAVLQHELSHQYELRAPYAKTVLAEKQAVLRDSSWRTPQDLVPSGSTLPS
ncbi:hypothetical protein HGRIS_004909 [Hohenbuehelia grisea]|uniref:Transaldolase n=1 Tax=Hohenbuehelia grisea TaxID=104357 RepID=A0ABR3JDD2_9AGAR